MKFYTILPTGQVVEAVRAKRRFHRSMIHSFELYVADLMGEKVTIDPQIPMGIGTEVQRLDDNEVEVLSYSSQYGACIVVMFDPSGEGPEPKVTMPGRWAELCGTAFSHHTSRRIAESWLLIRGGILSVDDHYYEVDFLDNLHLISKEDCVYRLCADKAKSS